VKAVLLAHKEQFKRVCGLTLIERAIHSTSQAGITDFIIVLGEKDKEVREFILKKFPSLKVQWIQLQKEEQIRGLFEALATYISNDFLLLKADRVIHYECIAHFIKFAQKQNQTLVSIATDAKMASIENLVRETKVFHQGFVLKNIGDRLEDYNALAVGLAIFSKDIFKWQGDFSTCFSKLLQNLSLSGEVKCCDVGSYDWQSVDSVRTLWRAEKLLLRWCRKPTDGLVARFLNRPVSLSISHKLCRTPVTPNFMTGVAFIIGLVSCFFAYKALFLLAFVFFQVASIFDGCDGEIAKLKFKKTKKGAWLDTVSDNITYVVFFLAFGWGMSEFTGNSGYLVYTGIILSFIITALGLMYIYLKRQKKEGTLVLIERAVNQMGKRNNIFFSFLPRYFSFMTKRDFFALFFLVLALFEQWQFIFSLTFVGSFFVFLYSLLLFRASFHQRSYEGTPLNIRKHFQKYLILFGLGLIVYLCYSVGFVKIGESFQSVGFHFLVIFFIAFGWHVLNTLSWHIVLPPNREVSFLKKLKIKLQAEAFNALTPFASSGGEPLRVFFMKNYYSLEEGTVAVILDKTIHMFCGFCFSIVGFLISLKILYPTIHPQIIFFLIMVGMFIVGTYIDRRQGRFLSLFLNFFVFFRIKFLLKYKEKILRSAFIRPLVKTCAKQKKRIKKNKETTHKRE